MKGIISMSARRTHEEDRRAFVIDYLEDNYNTDERHERLESELEKVSGKDMDYMDDSDTYEGMYANFSTIELRTVADSLDAEYA